MQTCLRTIPTSSHLSHCPVSSSLKAAQHDVVALLKVLKDAQSDGQSLPVTTQAALSLVAVSYDTLQLTLMSSPIFTLLPAVSHTGVL